MVEIKTGRSSGCITVPASKSQTIRAFLIAAFAKGRSVIRHPLLSSDTQSCIDAVRALGADVSFNEDYSIAYVDSSESENNNKGIYIDAGNSGTTEYLLLGLAASLGRDVTITGDEQLRSRPAGPLGQALSDLGAEISSDNGKPPVSIKGPLKGGHTVIECRTSQYLSSLLLASPLSEGECRIDCSLLYEKPYVRMTLDWLDKQGIEYRISEDLEHATICGGQSYKPFDEYINGDFSSASFFFAMAAISKSSVTVRGLDRNDPQGDKEILTVLEKMGCTIEWDGNAVTVTGPEVLKGGEFDLNSMPDTLPILAVTAAFADGDVHLTNVPQARIKETDRIATMCENLSLLGADAEEEPDGIMIHGKGYLKGGSAKGYGDHRIIMALAAAASGTEESVFIDDISAASVTFPSFFELYESIRRNK